MTIRGRPGRVFERGVAVFEKIYQTASGRFRRPVRPARSRFSRITRGRPRGCIGRGSVAAGSVARAVGSSKAWPGKQLCNGMGQRSRDAAGGWLQDIDGTFALALQDEATGKLVVVTDRLGTLHVYAARLGSTLLICTSSLVLAALLRASWDPAGCREFLARGLDFRIAHAVGRNRETAAGEPAGVLARESCPARASTGTLPIRCTTARPSAETCRNWQRRCGIALRWSAGIFRRPLFDLTGGLDSRAVVGAAVAAGLPIETTVNGPEDSPDVLAAAEVARYLGVRAPAQYARVWHRPQNGGTRRRTLCGFATANRTRRCMLRRSCRTAARRAFTTRA